MRPGQLSHHFLVLLIGVVELPHPEEIGASKSALAGRLARDGGGHIDHTLAPLGVCRSLKLKRRRDFFDDDAWDRAF